jgi:hypothetical protein
MTSVLKLKSAKWVFGTIPTFQELINPVEEEEIGQSLYDFDNDEAIITRVHDGEAEARGEVEEVELDDEAIKSVPVQDIIKMCKQLEKFTISTNTPSALEITHSLHHFHGELFSMQMQKAKQVTLTSMWMQKDERSVNKV